MNYIYTSTAGEVQSTPPQSTSTELPLIDQIRLIDINSEQAIVQKGLLLEKAMKSGDPATVLAAQKMWGDIQEREASGIKSQLVDPYELSSAMGYKYKASNLSFGMLRMMVRRTPIIGAVISTRQTQISAFARPQEKEDSTGFIIRKKRPFYSQEDVKLTKQDEQKIQEITQFVLDCGTQTNRWHGDTFEKFLKKVVKDALELDQACFEVARNKIGKPTEFLAVDGATIRIASSFDDDEKKTQADQEEQHGYLPSYVQVIDGKVYNQYYPWELCVGIRNDSTDINQNGYGRSELEDLINIITWMLFGDEYNGKFFSQGSSPKGMLKVAKGTNRSKLMEFRQQWMAMVAGVQNAWKVPIIESDTMEWIDMQKNNTDMQFAKWQEYLVRVVCAVYKIAPEEVGFDLGNASGGNPMSESSNEIEIKYSRDKGLTPLLTNLESWLNKWIINPYDSQFELKFVGLDIEDPDKQLDRDVKAVGSFMSLKEIRRKNGLPDKIDDDDMILNGVWLQKYNADQMQQQQIEQDGMQDEEEQDQQDQEPESDADRTGDWEFGKAHLGNPFFQNLQEWFEKEMTE